MFHKCSNKYEWAHAAGRMYVHRRRRAATYRTLNHPLMHPHDLFTYQPANYIQPHKGNHRHPHEVTFRRLQSGPGATQTVTSSIRPGGGCDSAFNHCIPSLSREPVDRVATAPGRGRGGGRRGGTSLKASRVSGQPDLLGSCMHRLLYTVQITVIQ